MPMGVNRSLKDAVGTPIEKKFGFGRAILKCEGHNPKERGLEEWFPHFRGYRMNVGATKTIKGQKSEKLYVRKSMEKLYDRN